MGFTNRFCGIHIKKYARVVAIIGIIFSCLSLTLSIFAWNYFPLSIAMLSAFVMVLFGLNKSRPGYLLAANVILGITILIDCLFFIASLYIAIDVPQEFLDDFHQSQIYNDWSNAKKDLQIAYFILAFILLCGIGLLIFAFAVIQKTRKYLLEHPRRSSLFPDTFIGPRPTHHYGFYSNSPMCSTDYNATQEMPAPPYYDNPQTYYSHQQVNPQTAKELGSGVILQVKPPKH